MNKRTFQLRINELGAKWVNGTVFLIESATNSIFIQINTNTVGVMYNALDVTKNHTCGFQFTDPCVADYTDALNYIQTLIVRRGE